MADILAQAEFLSAGRFTRRFNGWRVITTDYVGMHQCNVANIALLLRPDMRKELLVACIRHDSPEWASKLGDVPSPVKRRVPGLKEAADAEEARVWREAGVPDPCEGLTEEEYRVLKLADYLDGMMYCIQERQMGNQFMTEPFNNFMNYVISMLTDHPFGPEHELFNGLTARWAEVGGRFNVSE